MRVPYTVGRWVRGEQHYGRQRLITHLLTSIDNEFWLVGTRRMGKTSLLHQVELVADQGTEYVPLYCDLQGCQSPEDFTAELLFAGEDAAERLAAIGVEPADIPRTDAISTLRTLQRAADRHGRKLLLLVDEAEALIHIAKHEDRWLAQLRKALQDERQRTVITATKMLSILNDLNSRWMTSPFLFGFNLVNLWSLDADSAAGLVRQSQSKTPVTVDNALLAEVLHYTNRHPYLMQFLCQRLYVADGDRCWLRPIRDEDLIPDQLLAKFLEIDFNHLTSMERRILLTVHDQPALTDMELLSLLSDLSPGQIRTFVYGLHKLGYIREEHGRWFISNDYLLRWLQDHSVELKHAVASELSDSQLEHLIARSAEQERRYLQREILDLTARLRDLARRQASATSEEWNALQEEIELLRRGLDAAQHQLRLLGKNDADGGGNADPDPGTNPNPNPT